MKEIYFRACEIASSELVYTPVVFLYHFAPPGPLECERMRLVECAEKLYALDALVILNYRVRDLGAMCAVPSANIGGEG